MTNKTLTTSSLNHYVQSTINKALAHKISYNECMFILRNIIGIAVDHDILSPEVAYHMLTQSLLSVRYSLNKEDEQNGTSK